MLFSLATEQFETSFLIIMQKYLKNKFKIQRHNAFFDISGFKMAGLGRSLLVLKILCLLLENCKASGK